MCCCKVFGILIWVFSRRLRAGRGLRAFVTDSAVFNVQNADGTYYQLHTHTFVFRNTTNRTLSNLRIGHSFLPHFQVHPNLHHHVANSGRGQEIVVSEVAPGQQVSIVYLYYPQHLGMPINTYVRAGHRAVEMSGHLPAGNNPGWVAWLVRLVNLALLAAFVYGAYRILQWWNEWYDLPDWLQQWLT